MTSPWSRFRTLLVVVLVVGSVVTVADPVAGEQTSGNTSELPAGTAAGTFAVTQDETCYTVTPLGDGSQTVEEFYGYRDIESNYSSPGTTALQDNQVSNLFVYNGSQGYSLVLVHDEFAESPYGGTLTMTFTGLPLEGDWAVEDDDYENRNDNFDHFGTRSEIDWKWVDGRTDGGAFRGLPTGMNITIDPAFNEDAEAWGEWWQSGGNNRIESWRLYTDRESTTTLDMEQKVTITRGPCDSTPPTATVTASPASATSSELVTLDAGASTDNTGLSEFHWDLDGDGSVEETTTTPTVSHTYESPGDYEVTVTVTDLAGNEDTATTSVTIRNGSLPPTADLSVTPTNTTTSESVSFDAGASSDNSGIEAFHWDFDGDGTVEETTTTPTVSHTYASPGEYEATVTVHDEDDNNGTATRSVTITEETDTQPPTATLSGPETATTGESVTVRATELADDSGVAEVRWSVDGDQVGTGETLEYDFSTTGTHTVSVELTDTVGNTDQLSTDVQVTDPAGNDADAGESGMGNVVDDYTVDGRPAVTTVAMTSSSVSTGTPVDATAYFSSNGYADDTFTINMTLARIDSDGDRQTVVDRRDLSVSPGTTSLSVPRVEVAEPGRYRLSVGQGSRSFTVEQTSEGTASTTQSSTETASNETAEPTTTTTATTATIATTSTTDSQTEWGATESTTTTTTADDTDSTTTTSSGDGPGFGLLGGIVALALSLALLTRRE